MTVSQWVLHVRSSEIVVQHGDTCSVTRLLRAGQLEALILAAANTMEQLLQAHLITGKDTCTAIGGAPPHGATVTAGSGRFARPITSSLPRPTRHCPALTSSLHVAAAAPGSGIESPHVPVGVLAPEGEILPSPELVPVSPPLSNASLAVKARKTPSRSPVPMYHPPMRTGTSRVNAAAKATIAATARPVGIKAIKEHQRELERSMKVRLLHRTCQTWKILFDS
jgi:hypothetical protein